MDEMPRSLVQLLLAFSFCVFSASRLQADEPRRDPARPDERVASAANARATTPHAPPSIHLTPSLRSSLKTVALASMNWVFNPRSRLVELVALAARVQVGFQPFKTITDDDVDAVVSAVKEGKKAGDDYLGYKLAPVRFLWDVAAAKFLDVLYPDSVILDPSWDEETAIGVKANHLRYKNEFYGKWAYVLAALVYAGQPLQQFDRDLLLGYQEPPPALILSMPVASAGAPQAPAKAAPVASAQAPAKSLPMAVAPAKTLPMAIAPSKTLPMAARPPAAPSAGSQVVGRPAAVSLAERR